MNVPPINGAPESSKDPSNSKKGKPPARLGKGANLAEGLFNGRRTGNKHPKYLTAMNEVVYNNGNTWIILGEQERISDISSGRGGAGETDSGVIDIVVGLGGRNASDQISYNKNFGADGKTAGDSARIFIAQRTGIDNNFGLNTGGDGGAEERSVDKSAIALKADDIRLVARRAIRLVTLPAYAVDSSDDKKPKEIVFGIDLIAGNHTETDNQTSLPYLQPIPKGENLLICLNKMNEQITTLNGAVSDLFDELVGMVQLLVTTPIMGNGPMGPIMSSFLAGPTGEMMNKKLIRLVRKSVRKSELFQKERNIKSPSLVNDHFDPSSPLYILSLHNRTN